MRIGRKRDTEKPLYSYMLSVCYKEVYYLCRCIQIAVYTNYRICKLLYIQVLVSILTVSCVSGSARSSLARSCEFIRTSIFVYK